MDAQWWGVHIKEVRRVFAGECLGYGADSAKYGVRPMRRVKGGWQAFGNSGAGAIAVAALSGAQRVLMLGYDCQHTDGKRHWHGDHPQGTNGNASPTTVARWPEHFRKLREAFRDIEIINCSRQTALTVFKRATIEEALA